MQIIKKNEKKRSRGVHIEREFEDSEENRILLCEMVMNNYLNADVN